MNLPPYDFGSYDTIATNRGRRYGRSKLFSVGYTMGKREEPDYKCLKATYVDSHGQPKLSILEGKTRSLKFVIQFADKQASVKVTYRKSANEQPLDYSFEIPLPPAIGFQIPVFAMLLPYVLQGKPHPEKISHEIVEEMSKELTMLFIGQVAGG